MRHGLEEIGFKCEEIQSMTERDVDIYLSLHKKNIEQSENNKIGDV